MLLFLVFLIVLILLFGASAVLSKFLGFFAWILGLLGLLFFLVWASTTFDVEPAAVLLLLFVAGAACFFGLLAWGYIEENKTRPANKKLTFVEFWRESQKNLDK